MLTHQTFNTPNNTTYSLQRIELLNRLLDKSFSSLRLIIGPAGFGKSTLLEQYVSASSQQFETIKVVWLSLDSSDNEENQFFRGLCRALRLQKVVSNDFEKSAINRINSQTLDNFSQSITRQMLASPWKLLLVFDDLHFITSQRIFSFINQLLEEKREQIQVAIGSRITPPLNLSLRYVQEDIVHILPDELGFTLSETLQLLPMMPPNKLKTFHDKTDGWPVAIQLFRTLAFQKPGAEFEEVFSGSSQMINRYLSEQVFSNLHESEQDLLMHVSFLERFSLDLANHLYDKKDNHKVLRDLKMNFTLIHSLDQFGHNFKLHQLFADFLQQHLIYKKGVDYLLSLRKKAAEWHCTNGNILEAVKQYVKADDIAAAEQILREAGGWAVVMTSGISIAESILNYFPSKHIVKSITLLLMKAYLALKFGNILKASEWFDMASNLHDNQKLNNTYNTEFWVMWLTLKVYTDENINVDRFNESKAIFNKLLPGEHILRGTVLAEQAVMLNQIGKFAAAEEKSKMSLLEMQLACCPIGVNYALFHYGLSLCYQGKLQRATDTLEEASEMAKQHLGIDNGLSHMANGALSYVEYQRNQLNDNTASLESSINVLEQNDCWVELYLIVYQISVEIALTNGEPSRARSYIARGRVVANAREYPRLTRLLDVLDFKTSIIMKEFTGSFFQWITMFEGLEQNEWQTELALGSALSVLLWQRNQFTKSKQFAQKTLKKAASLGVVYAEAFSRGMLIINIHSQKGGEACIHELLTLINLCSESGLIRPLLLLPSAFEGVVQNLKFDTKWSSMPPSTRELVNRFLESKKSQQKTITTEFRFTHRELQLIDLLKKGLSNKQISSNMGVSVNTVKFHLKNLFNKLSVSNRTAAVSKL